RREDVRPTRRAPLPDQMRLRLDREPPLDGRPLLFRLRSGHVKRYSDTPSDIGAAVDLTFTKEQEAFRREVRSWLEANVPRRPLPSLDTAAGFDEHRGWERALHGDGWAAVAWPKEYGGRGASL